MLSGSVDKTFNSGSPISILGWSSISYIAVSIFSMTFSGLGFVLLDVGSNGCWGWNVEPFFGDFEKTLLNVGDDSRIKLLNIGGGDCGRLKLLNAGGGGNSCDNVSGIKLLNVVGDGGSKKLLLLLLLLLLFLLKILSFLKASSHFIFPTVGLVLVPFQEDHSQCLFCQYQVPLAKSWRQSFVHQMF